MNTNQNIMDTNEYMNINSNPSRITKFLWWCAGADEFFLKQSPKQDRVKYAGIGAIVFFTGLLAGVSGFIAVDTMFGPKTLDGETHTKLTGIQENFWIISSIFAVIWGILIFNLDRFIVSSTGKGDGTDKITGPEFAQAIPRILIALVLGFSISKPLEILMLKSEIDVELGIKQQKKREQYDLLTRAKYEKQISFLDNELNKIEKERSSLVEIERNADKKYTDQMEGRSGGKIGDGPIAKRLKIIWDDKKKSIIEFDKKNKFQLSSLKSDRAQLLKDQNYELNVKNKEKARKLDGLLARLDISHEIGFWLGLAITAILLCIEMGPIFFKMMMSKGPYDYMVENFNHKIQTENGVFKEDKLYEGRNGLIHMEKYRYADVELAKHEREVKLEEQKKITSQIVSKWGEKKMEEINDNPDAFLNQEK
jgi:hypothetical protein